MPNKRFQCRTHGGGIFSMPARRGRPPVRCTESHPCDRAEMLQTSVRDVPGIGKVAVHTLANAPESVHEARSTANDSLPLAMAAKARLEAVGWICKGRAWIDVTSATVAPAEHCAEVTCSRGAETLIIVWVNGVLKRQDYQMESIRPAENGIPANSLNFDPNEMTDGELVRMVRGMKVTWWNTIAGSRETAIVGPNNVAVEHLFVGGGDTDNSKRIIKFLDHSGGGFRAFHVGALLKVG
jgi:hypothetical protein